MSQNDQIIALLLRGWVTPYDALKKCGSMKLASRISEIRPIMSSYIVGSYGDWRDQAQWLSQQGYRLMDKWVHLPSGKKIKAYRIAK